MTLARSSVGIGLRQPHYRAVGAAGVAAIAPASFVEVHSENFFGAGGAALAMLARVRADLPVSLHGVGLGLGNAHGLDPAHLRALRALADRIEPALVSEHVCWTAMPGAHFNDLLPLPYTRAALATLVEHIEQTQEALGRRILIENATAYLRFADDEMDELSFMAEAAQRSGCGVLFDVNNLYVNSVNFGFDPVALLDRLPVGLVEEMHLAGHCVSDECLIDDHGARVTPAVWALYDAVLARFGAAPTLIEWDTRVPALEVLIDEASIASKAQARVQADVQARNTAITASVEAAHEPTEVCHD